MDAPVVIVGLGLMGGSLAAALARRGRQVRVHARRAESMRCAEERGWGEPAPDLARAARDAGLVVIAAPVSAIPALARTAATAGAATITDLGSTKLTLQDALADLHESGRYIGSHPMCGSHLQGLEHADPDLYTGARVVVTPAPTAPAAARERVVGLWRALGAEVLEMSAAEHDHAVANASHLPHVLAAAAAVMLDDEGLRVAASGFRDTTRVAAGDPALWSGILRENRSAVDAQLAIARDKLEDLRSALAADDAEAVLAWLQAARDARQRFDRRGRAEA